MAKEKAKRQKIEKEEKFKVISVALKAKNYTKKNVPTINQINKFLKKEKSVTNPDLNSITEENVLEMWSVYN